MSANPTALTPSEQADLTSYEKIIQRGLDTFVAVGTALLRIREQKLYRAYDMTFEEYCQRRWQLKQARAYHMIEAAKVVANLTEQEDKVQTSTNGITLSPPTLPTSERQARPLAKLQPGQQREAWKEAVDSAPPGKVTAKIVEAAVERIAPKPAKPEPPINVADTVAQASAANAARAARPPLPKPTPAHIKPARQAEEQPAESAYGLLEAAFLDLFSFAAEVKPLAALQDRRVLVNASALSDLREAVNRANRFKLEVLGKD
jgi:hypothetical protein